MSLVVVAPSFGDLVATSCVDFDPKRLELSSRLEVVVFLGISSGFPSRLVLAGALVALWLEAAMAVSVCVCVCIER